MLSSTEQLFDNLKYESYPNNADLFDLTTQYKKDCSQNNQ